MDHLELRAREARAEGRMGFSATANLTLSFEQSAGRENPASQQGLRSGVAGFAGLDGEERQPADPSAQRSSLPSGTSDEATRGRNGESLSDNAYAETVKRFARLGATIYQIDPLAHYMTIGRKATRPLEPGYIPIEKPARVVTVSFYPNASELPSPEYKANRGSLDVWGRSGTVADYVRAYSDWVALLPQIPFYRDFNLPVFAPLGIKPNEFAWLPLVKCPLPARTKIDEHDIWRDRMLLWDQLQMLRPPVILAQGVDAYNIVRDMCEEKFPHRLVLQKIGRYGTTAFHAGEDEAVVQNLRAALTGSAIS